MNKGNVTLALLLLPALLATSACGAEKITLNCSGTQSSPNSSDQPITSFSLVIDQQEKAVTPLREGVSMGRTFPIVEQTDSVVRFRLVAEDGQTVVGVIDRVSGLTTVSSSSAGTVLWTYNLKCERAKPIF
jgi:hypothetical protein